MQKQSLGNFDLFRIIVMCMVVMHHYPMNYSTANLSSNPSIIVAFFLEHLNIIAVNCFVIMSGYFLSRSQFKISKAINLLSWLSIYGVLLYVVFTYFGYGDPFSVGMFAKSFFPIFFGGWWFMFSYFALFVFSPFLNILVDALSYKQYIMFLLALFCIEVLWPSIIKSSAIDQQAGYSLYNFIFLYFVGGHFRKYDYLVSKRWILFLIVSLVAISTVLHFLITNIIPQLNFFNIGERFLHYNFVFVSLMSILFFILFTQIKFENKYVTYIRPHVLAVYLIHTHTNVKPFLYNTLFSPDKYQQSWLLLPHLFFYTIVTFTLCVLIDIGLQFIFGSLIDKMGKKLDAFFTLCIEKVYTYVHSFVKES